MPATIDIRRAADRVVTTTPWLTSRHSFSFGDHYDPANTHHGVLMVSNDDIVAPGAGFDTHPHRDMEIVTWVLDGSLAHQDSTGTRGVIYPGLAQRMSAGRGITHSERNASASEPVRFVQMWVRPDTVGIEPGYQQHPVDIESLAGRLVPIASGDPGRGAAIHIHNRAATLSVARLRPGDVVTLPHARYLHLFVADGHVDCGDTTLDDGDAVRSTGAGPTTIHARRPSEILVWEMHAGLGD
jgi:quercetin 2,3-dioxygenase